MAEFSFGHATGAGWREAADQCLTALGPVSAAGNLGFLYVTDALASHMGEILDLFQADTGVEHWVGTVGMGICATGIEYYDQPAVAAMVGEFPEGSFRVFPSMLKDLDDFTAAHGAWIESHRPFLGLVHGDPSNPLTEALVTVRHT